MYSYRTDYPNQVHQMNISLSKHLYILKDKKVKYQAKKFDINWKNYKKTGKAHLVNFLIRDHFSNCFYAEIHSVSEMPSTADFLFNAWKSKSNFEFCGIPKTLILGKKVISDFPQILNLHNNLDTFNLQAATSGFDTAIRSIRDWEDCILYNLGYTNYNTLKDIQDNNQFFCREYNLRESGKTESNLKKWATNIRSINMINDRNKFMNLLVIE